MILRGRTVSLALVLALGGLAASLDAILGRAAHAQPSSGLVCPDAPAPECTVVVVPVVGTPCPQDPPVPVVALRVRVPACAAPGQPLEYRICVENTSGAPAHHVLVRNPLPAHARYVRAEPAPTSVEPDLVWALGTLPPCGCREICLVLQPTGTGDIRSCARVQFEHGQCVTTLVSRPRPPAALVPEAQPPQVPPQPPAEPAGPRPGPAPAVPPSPPPASPPPASPPPAPPARLDLRKTGPSDAAAEEPLQFRLVVTNVGAGEATDVLLTDLLDVGLHYMGQGPANPGERQLLTWKLGTLGPGQSRVIEYQALARQTGRLCNRAQVTAAGGLREEAQWCVRVGRAELVLTKTGPDDALVGRPLNYQLTVGNSGTMPAANVVLVDELPGGVQFDSASDGGVNLGNQVRWDLGTLAPGTRRTVRLRLIAQAPGRITNRAYANADRSVRASGEMTTVVPGSGGLTFQIDKENDPVEVGTPTTFTITVRNQGNDALRGLRVVAGVPEQMEVSTARGPQGVDFKRAGPVLTFEPLAELRPQGDAVYQVSVVPRKPGDVRFVVELSTAEPRLGPVRKETSTTIASP